MAVPEKDKKSALKSRTVQLNSLFAAIAMVAALDPSLFAVLGPKGLAIGTAIVSLANLALRFIPEPQA